MLLFNRFVTDMTYVRQILQVWYLQYLSSDRTIRLGIYPFLRFYWFVDPFHQHPSPFTYPMSDSIHPTQRPCGIRI
jgi:hypothetical protein